MGWPLKSNVLFWDNLQINLLASWYHMLLVVWHRSRHDCQLCSDMGVVVKHSTTLEDDAN